MWLAQTPTALVQAHVTMMPKLEAEEAIGHANASALGAGSAPGDVMRRFGADMTSAAGAGEPVQKADPAPLLVHGFAVRRVPKVRQG